MLQVFCSWTIYIIETFFLMYRFRSLNFNLSQMYFHVKRLLQILHNKQLAFDASKNPNSHVLISISYKHLYKFYFGNFSSVTLIIESNSIKCDHFLISFKYLSHCCQKPLKYSIIWENQKLNEFILCMYQ